jgi:hypothetical protein
MQGKCESQSWHRPSRRGPSNEMRIAAAGPHQDSWASPATEEKIRQQAGHPPPPVPLTLDLLNLLKEAKWSGWPHLRCGRSSQRCILPSQRSGRPSQRCGRPSQRCGRPSQIFGWLSQRRGRQSQRCVWLCRRSGRPSQRCGRPSQSSDWPSQRSCRPSQRCV